MTELVFWLLLIVIGVLAGVLGSVSAEVTVLKMEMRDVKQKIK
jgi:hypothetical protein